MCLSELPATTARRPAALGHDGCRVGLCEEGDGVGHVSHVAQPSLLDLEFGFLDQTLPFVDFGHEEVAELPG